MYEVYLEDKMVFEGATDEVNEYCNNHAFDIVIDKTMIEVENMIAAGYTWDSYYDHY